MAWKHEPEPRRKTRSDRERKSDTHPKRRPLSADTLRRLVPQRRTRRFLPPTDL
jgi:hypothetical protein